MPALGSAHGVCKRICVSGFLSNLDTFVRHGLDTVDRGKTVCDLHASGISQPGMSQRIRLLIRGKPTALFEGD